MTVVAPESFPLIAAIDLGSNSFHMVLARVDQGEIRILERLGEKVQLAAGLDEQRLLTEEAMQRGLWEQPGDYRGQLEELLLAHEERLEGGHV